MKAGEKIKQYRLTKGLTQEQLGELLNVSRTTVSSWELNRNIPDMDTIIDICDLMHVSIDSFIREDRDMTKKISLKLKWNTYLKYTVVFFIIATVTTGLILLNKEHIRAKYEVNLKHSGWTHSKNIQFKTAYDLKEDNITYNTAILPTIFGQELDIYVRYQKLLVIITGSKSQQIFIQKYNNKNSSETVIVNKDAKLIKPNRNWSKLKVRQLENILNKNQNIYKYLIKKGHAKQNQIR